MTMVEVVKKNVGKIKNNKKNKGKLKCLTNMINFQRIFYIKIVDDLTGCWFMTKDTAKQSW